jgi:hypothetical protein
MASEGFMWMRDGLSGAFPGLLECMVGSHFNSIQRIPGK